MTTPTPVGAAGVPVDDNGVPVIDQMAVLLVQQDQIDDLTDAVAALAHRCQELERRVKQCRCDGSG